jgi:RimJ/RimL family protein N-acetyltransferase
MMRGMLDAVTLDGRFVSLVPLSIDHVDALAAVGCESSLWRWVPATIASRDDMRRYIEVALADQRRGTALPFVQVERATGTVVGSTRYGNVALEHRRLEIGWTWLGLAWQRTPVNTEAKWLLLRHAFEALGCERVELKTDALNATSRAAIQRIGGVEEGTLRRHMLTASGRWRDTVYYSIVRDEWPAVSARLLDRLSRGPVPA